jgi:hypothetical protein
MEAYKVPEFLSGTYVRRSDPPGSSSTQGERFCSVKKISLLNSGHWKPETKQLNYLRSDVDQRGCYSNGDDDGKERKDMIEHRSILR